MSTWSQMCGDCYGREWMSKGFTKLSDGLYGYMDTKTDEHSVVYLIVGTERAVLFDAGTGLDDVSVMVAAITSLPVTVLLSHWHHDHVGSAHLFDDVTAWHSPATEALRSKGIDREAMAKLSGSGYADQVGAVPPLTRLQLIDQERKIELGTMSINVLHTPGHTMDSVCLYVPEKRWLFTGDTLYDGPLYVGLPDSSVSAYRASLKRLMKLDVSRLFPGHNGFLCPIRKLHGAYQWLDEVE